MVVAEAVTGLSALKTMFDITKTIKSIDDRTRINEAVIELQEKILTAQTAQATLVEQVRELEAEMARMKAWDADKQRYELKELHRGLFAYILKVGCEDGETPHALCANCYQRGTKALLQSNGEAIVHKHAWFCAGCKTNYKCERRNMSSMIAAARKPSEHSDEY